MEVTVAVKQGMWVCKLEMSVILLERHRALHLRSIESSMAVRNVLSSANTRKEIDLSLRRFNVSSY